MLIVFLLIANITFAQSLEGNWRGTSLCQMKNSPCHDETVVYHIKESGTNSYKVDASKIIDGKEDDMGTLSYSFDPSRNILYSIDNVKEVKWEFKVTGNQMHGTLTYKGKLFRIIDLKKEG